MTQVEVLTFEWNQDILTTPKYIQAIYTLCMSFEQRIAELENEDRLGLDTGDKLRIQLEERLDCTIHESQMSLILEYIYAHIGYKERKGGFGSTNV